MPDAHEANPPLTDRYLLLPSTAMYDFDFLLRLRAGLAARRWRIVVVTHLISVWLKARREGVDCVLIRARRRAQATPQIDIDQTHEGRMGLLPTHVARRFEAAAWAAMEDACTAFPVAAVIQWNGQGLMGKLASQFARRRGLATAFVELGNVGRRLFVDPEGVSGAALVARHPELLERYEIDEAEIANWRERMAEHRRQEAPIPQARNLRRINPWYPINTLGGWLFGLPAPASAGLAMRLKRQLRLVRNEAAPVRSPPERFVLLALQVSSDTNLLLFSDCDSLRAIEVAEARAGVLGLPLVVKPHPAERDIKHSRSLRRHCEGRGHVWTGFNTTALILQAAEVITINSSVGLMARALETPTTFLGRSLYGRFTPRQAAAFVLRHLVHIDPFDDAPASQAAVDHLLAIMTMSPPEHPVPSADRRSDPADPPGRYADERQDRRRPVSLSVA
jgi:capsular polysaccharide export protein